MIRKTTLALLVSASLAGCADMDDRGKSAVGGAIGGAGGAVIGYELGGRQGAVVGAGVGAATGVAVGQKQGRSESDGVVVVDGGGHHGHSAVKVRRDICRRLGSAAFGSPIDRPDISRRLATAANCAIAYLQGRC